VSADAILFAQTYRRLGRGGPTCMLLLRDLARLANRDQYIDSRSVRQLADGICRDPRTVPRVIAKLVADGALSVTHRFEQKRGQIVNLYRVLTETVVEELANIAHPSRQWTAGEVCPKCRQPMHLHFYVDAESLARGVPRCPPMGP